MKWTDEMIDRLIEGRKNGVSSTILAKELGITKNAVLGKASRLGLPRIDEKECKFRAERYFKGESLRNYTKVVTHIGNGKFGKLYENHTQIEPTHKPLIELAPKECRFPVTDSKAPQVLFCAAHTDKYPYCDEHRAKCYKGGLI